MYKIEKCTLGPVIFPGANFVVAKKANDRIIGDANGANNWGCQRVSARLS